jgi:GNAT superfamily N-acetyltransferase
LSPAPNCRPGPTRWWVSPLSQPADLGARLAAHGLSHVVDAAGMAIDLSTLHEPRGLPADLAIEHVADPAGLKRWIDVLAAGFSFPELDARWWYDIYASFGFAPSAPWHHFVGLLAGEPIATASVFLGGGVAGLYHVVTLAHGRGRGIASAITAAALAEARARRYRVAALQSSAMAQRVYAALGFQACGTFSMYAWRPTPRATGQ